MDSSWMDEYEECDVELSASDTDVGSKVLVKGLLHDGTRGMVLLTRTPTVWEQRGRLSTAHLNADYVSGESLADILEKWVPVDFSMAEAIHVDPAVLAWESLETM